MFSPADGPAAQDRVLVSTSVVTEIKVGATSLPDRVVVTIQPLDGNIWVYFGDGVNTPSAVTVAAKGFKHIKMTKDTYEAGEKQPLYILAETAPTAVTFVERA